MQNFERQVYVNIIQMSAVLKILSFDMWWVRFTAEIPDNGEMTIIEKGKWEDES